MANDIKYLQKEVLYTDTTAVTLGYIPANAYVVDIIVNVETAFNAGGNDYLDIGKTGTANYYADNVNVASTGKASVTLLKGGIVESTSDPTTVTAVYVPAGTSPSAGKCKVTILYAYNEAT